MKQKNRNKKPEIMEIGDKLWEKMMNETLQGVFKMLDSAEILINNEDFEAVSAGLYTYAVEEYGKLQLLKQYTPLSGKVKIKYKNEFLDHRQKFGIAIQTLPSECTTIGIIGFELGFEEGFQREKIISDFEARKAVFYSDFENFGNNIKPLPNVNKSLLKKAIIKFREIALGTKIP